MKKLTVLLISISCFFVAICVAPLVITDTPGRLFSTFFFMIGMFYAMYRIVRDYPEEISDTHEQFLVLWKNSKKFIQEPNSITRDRIAGGVIATEIKRLTEAGQYEEGDKIPFSIRRKAATEAAYFLKRKEEMRGKRRLAFTKPDA